MINSGINVNIIFFGLIIIAAIAIVVIIVLGIYYIRRNDGINKVSKETNANENYVKVDNNEDKLKFIDGDTILSQGQTYKCSLDGPLLPGSYTIFSGNENMNKFNIRIQGYVRECVSNTEIVISLGDEITPVSCNVYLK